MGKLRTQQKTQRGLERENHGKESPLRRKVEQNIPVWGKLNERGGKLQEGQASRKAGAPAHGTKKKCPKKGVGNRQKKAGHECETPPSGEKRKKKRADKCKTSSNKRLWIE